MFEEELFRSQTGFVGATEGKNLQKASLFTLIVLVKDATRTLFMHRLVELIMKKFPCKVVFISIDTGAKESFLNQNRSTFIVGEGAAAISCDVLSITTSKDNLQRVPFLVIPEIIADLPAFALLGHDPSELRTVVDQLEPLVNRIIFDANSLKNIGQFAEGISSLPHKQKYVDLNWARTKPWRESFARVFNTKESFAHLSSANRIEISYSRRPSSTVHTPDTQAILFQAWLASRLGWEPTSVEDTPDQMIAHYTSRTEEIDIILTPTDSIILDDGNIASIEIRGEKELHYLLEYERDDRHIVVHASSQDRCEMPYALFVGSFQRGRALPSEIFLQATSDHYLPMLELLSSRIWQHDRDA